MGTPTAWSYVCLKYLSSFCFITAFTVVCSHGLQFSSQCCFSAKKPKRGTKWQRIYFSSPSLKQEWPFYVSHSTRDALCSAVTELMPQRQSYKPENKPVKQQISSREMKLKATHLQWGRHPVMKSSACSHSRKSLRAACRPGTAECKVHLTCDWWGCRKLYKAKTLGECSQGLTFLRIWNKSRSYFKFC